MKNAKPTKMLRVREVAERLDVSERTVFRWLERSELIGHRLGRSQRISEADLELFLFSAQTKGR